MKHGCRILIPRTTPIAKIVPCLRRSWPIPLWHMCLMYIFSLPLFFLFSVNTAIAGGYVGPCQVWGREYDTAYFVFLKYQSDGNNEIFNLFDEKGDPLSSRFLFCRKITRLNELNAILDDERNFEETEVESSFAMYGFAFYQNGRLVMTLVPDLYCGNLGAYPYRSNYPGGWSQRGIDRIQRYSIEMIAYPRDTRMRTIPKADAEDFAVDENDGEPYFFQREVAKATMAIKNMEKINGQYHQDLVPLLERLADIFMYENEGKQYALAEDTCNRALAIMEKIHGSDSLEIITNGNHQNQNPHSMKLISMSVPWQLGKKPLGQIILT
jgi:hypothetical protein